ncbi:SDR family NAD(P)-dependent oxidoreductase [Cryobacterium sp. TMT1-21]|uniref:SDR family NAD(P)-dependent oxidoreductase n=1 Tax=Cryobacterium shii TaxID=1259235 RepID=A0AAQ2HGY0_9MICO|nr:MULTISPECIES: SDR family NAD(P)-dependent oxidoreductase [Cryobacterium]TFC52606.1 SDR family NAD(P)-dependent oxidoreductase [Cryobacterium shii]TFC82388.1 SDR family NAD(P)-dependent oxidoreductase [Cryobacterium sp. TmT2-59]TFD16390.1 SDR family NAD(P)-dependent oxidoreductase [Cryobacterium sp. TMT1-21]TFD17703.1 SDR family NAD(P)-dependent oxidoreductase [Cryobacterium sp. TMT4-10]TFD27980.1 SDR family NAD(P)-dependent oxidoreductase [Cryobacterium sp. TMT2-23]
MTLISDSAILVVGASGGLGREIARLLNAGGARLILTGRDRTKLAALGIHGTVLEADLSDPAAIVGLVADAVGVHGRLDGIVNASGVVAFGPATEVSDETLAELFAVNTLAPIRLLRAARAALTDSAEQGREPFVLTLSGVVSESPTANLAAYSASKAGLAAFGQAAARELRRSGIRIVDARPGHTETALSTHPISGTAPRLPSGYPPAAVAQRLVDAIIGGERDLPSTAFQLKDA